MTPPCLTPNGAFKPFTSFKQNTENGLFRQTFFFIQYDKEENILKKNLPNILQNILHLIP